MSQGREFQLSSIVYVASILGLSVASLVGVSKVLGRFKQAKLYFRRSQEEGAALSEEIGKRDAEISALRRSLTTTRAEAQALEEVLAALRQKVDRMTSNLEELGRELESSRAQNHVLEDQVHGQTKEAQTLRDETQRVKAKHGKTLELLESRTSELKGAQAYLTKADYLSGADVIAMLEALNSEILQTAAFVAESFDFDEKDTRSEEDSEEMKEACARATEILGSRMVELLKSSEHHEDPILVQIAFQAGMSAYSEWMISSWYFENPQNEQLLTEIYERIRESEDQAVYGRWRALTRTHAQRTLNQEPDLAMYFVDAFINVLIVAGFKGSQSVLHEMITSRFSERIAIIVQSALQLNKAIGEGVTSCDLDAIYIAPHAKFDPSMMDDTFGRKVDHDMNTTEPVLCTTDLGLFRAEKISGLGKWQEAILLKPKIVLQSGLTRLQAVTIYVAYLNPGRQLRSTLQK